MVIVLFLALISLGTWILHRASKFSGTALRVNVKTAGNDDHLQLSSAVKYKKHNRTHANNNNNNKSGYLNKMNVLINTKY